MGQGGYGHNADADFVDWVNAIWVGSVVDDRPVAIALSPNASIATRRQPKRTENPNDILAIDGGGGGCSLC